MTAGPARSIVERVTERVERRDVEAALEARRELGPAYEDDIVDNLVAKIERRLDERRPQVPARHHHVDLRLPLGSIALGIGVTAVALNGGGNGNAGAGRVIVTIIAWIAIAIVNAAYALRR